jgi:hypothetical protein
MRLSSVSYLLQARSDVLVIRDYAIAGVIIHMHSTVIVAHHDSSYYIGLHAEQ